jgi:hypothetical protein
MDVAAYRDGRVDRDDVSFFYEEFASLVAQFADLGLRNRSARAQLRDGSGGESAICLALRRVYPLAGLLVKVTHRRADELRLGFVHMGACWWA